MFGQCFGSAIFRNWRYALRRNSSIHSGSPFFSLMRRTVSSLSPFGMTSDSISVTKPYLYSLFVSSSIELISLSFPSNSFAQSVNLVERRRRRRSDRRGRLPSELRERDARESALDDFVDVDDDGAYA